MLVLRLPLSCLLCSLALLIAGPVAALAQETNAPPGNSAIDEYLEAVPAADGDRPTQNVAPPEQDRATDRDVRGLPAQARRDLEQAGGDGQRLEEFVEATTPGRTSEGANASPSRGRGGDGPGEGAGGVAGAREEEDGPAGRSPVASVVDAVADPSASGTGMGALLPVLLVLALVAALAAKLARTRPER